MTINIQYVKIKASESMSAYVTKKLEKMAKKYEWVIRTDVFLETENDPTEKGHICKMEVSLPGPKIFAASNEKNFELAVKGTIKDIDKQLKKRKAIFTKQNISS